VGVVGIGGGVLLNEAQLLLSVYSLHVQCKYTGRQETGLQINVTVYTVSPPPPASVDGILKLELRIAKGRVALGNGEWN